MKAVRRRISDARFMSLLWKTIRAGHVDVGLFRAATTGRRNIAVAVEHYAE